MCYASYTNAFYYAGCSIFSTKVKDNELILLHFFKIDQYYLINE